MTGKTSCWPCEAFFGSKRCTQQWESLEIAPARGHPQRSGAGQRPFAKSSCAFWCIAASRLAQDTRISMKMRWNSLTRPGQFWLSHLAWHVPSAWSRDVPRSPENRPWWLVGLWFWNLVSRSPTTTCYLWVALDFKISGHMTIVPSTQLAGLDGLLLSQCWFLWICTLSWTINVSFRS